MMDLGKFAYGNSTRKIEAAGFQCCGKPVGCTNRDERCAYRNHRWKREVLMQEQDQLVFGRVRERLIQEAPHVHPGSISYLAWAWQFMIDEWLKAKGSRE